MDLIKNFYRNNEKSLEKISNLVISDSDIGRIKYWLNNMRFYDDSIDYLQFTKILGKIFNELGISKGDLSNFKTDKTRFSNDTFNKVGSFSFNYCDSNNGTFEKKNMVTCYACNELVLFNGYYNDEPIIKIDNGNTSFYYSFCGDEIFLIKYEIKLKDDNVLVRDIFNDKVIFNFDGLNSCFIIQIDGIKELNNEMLLVDYLRNLTYPYDMVDVYNKLCEISIGNDLSKYSLISLNEYKRISNDWKVINSISVSNGEINNVVRTVGDKTISCDGNGNWNYVLEDNNITLSISSGNKTICNIVAKNDDIFDDYIKDLFSYDVNVARSEVNDFKVKIRRKLGLDSKIR